MHDHGHAHGLDARRADSRRRLWIALAINGAMLGVEVVGGILTGSLAVLADAGHLLSDVGSIGLALFAAALASRPGGARRTFGYQRSEVLAALANGLLLVAVAIAVAVAAIGRLGDPPAIDGGGVLALGLIGLAGNVAATVVLAGGRREDINLEGALRHSLADALGSVGVVLAGAFVLAGGSAIVDPIVGLVIAVADPRLLLAPDQGAGRGADGGRPGRASTSTRWARRSAASRAVRSVHDLHVWTVTPGFGALAAHVVVAAGSDRDLTRRRLELLLHERFELDHTTLQMEEEAVQGLLEVERTPPEG